MVLKRIEREKMNPLEMIKEKKALADKLEEEFKSNGVVSFIPDNGLNINKDFLELPKEITEVSSRELGEYLNAFTQQNMYMKTLLGWAECYLEDNRRAYFEVSADKYRELNNTKLSETAKEREINSDPIIHPYYNEYMESKLRINLLKGNIESISDAIFTISREVSRRNGDFDNERRYDNIQKK